MKHQNQRAREHRKGIIAYTRGCWRKAIVALTTALDLCARHGWTREAAIAAWFLTRIYHNQERPAKAARHLGFTVALQTELGIGLSDGQSLEIGRMLADLALRLGRKRCRELVAEGEAIPLELATELIEP
jgi:hypothetical protein